MARYLVTGGAGFVGSHLVELLRVQGHAVRVLDDLSSGSRANLPPQTELVVADVIDTEAVARAFDGVDGCFHLAAIASVERSHRGWVRTHQVNLTGTINVFDQAARQAQHRRVVPVVYASSAAVYGDCRAVPIGEDSPANPLSAYGADKLACEFHARIAGAIHGVPTTGLRFFNLYGPRQDPRSPYSGVISIFADRLLRGEPVDIFGDGEQVRDFTYVEDAVAALRRAMVTASTGAPVFNVCTGARHQRARPRRDDCGLVRRASGVAPPPGAVGRDPQIDRRSAPRRRAARHQGRYGAGRRARRHARRARPHQPGQRPHRRLRAGGHLAAPARAAGAIALAVLPPIAQPACAGSRPDARRRPCPFSTATASRSITRTAAGMPRRSC